jgi:hypothetical protein
MAKMGGSTRVQWLVGIWFSTALGFGCGSSDKTAQTAAPITTVDQSKALSALSSSEMQTLCTDFEKYLVEQTAQAYASRVCISMGVFASDASVPSQASQACHDAYDSCMDPTVPKTTAGISIDVLCPATPSAPSCSLTVSQYILCLSDLSAAANAIWALQNNLCDNLASCSGTGCNGSMTLSASCQLVNTTCAGIGPQVRNYITVTS